MMTDSYKRLGDYIREVDVRNRNLEVKLSQGISNEKHFQQPKQVAENPYNDKVVRKGQFAFNRATTRNGDKISIAYREDEDCTVSASYCVFYVTNENVLLSKYLMMWFRRPEFDRYAIYHSHGSAHEYFTYENMCDVELPVPSIEQQQKIVSEYEAVTRRLRLNEQIIAKLEETAQALYRKMFVDGIDKENLPEGWRIGTLGEIAEVNSGKTCKNKSEQQTEIYQWPVAGASGIIGYSPTYNQDERFITIGRVGTLGVVNRYDRKAFCADNVLIIKSSHYEYCYQILHSIDYKELAKGGVQSLITQTDLKNVEALLPDEYTLNLFEKQVSCLSSQVRFKKQENIKLTELQSLLLAKMGQK